MKRNEVRLLHFKKAKTILSARNGMNIYRGCTHGCIYCDSRSNCYNINHDFEDIQVKSNALELLEDALRRKRNPCMISTGAMCDPYMPEESSIRYTRKCLEIIEHYGFGVCIQTKSDAILDDLVLLKKIHHKAKCVVEMTLTTHDEQLCKIIEPNVCSTYRRYQVLKTLQEHGIPTIVWMTPILPFINDTQENIRGILKYCIDAKVMGILCFGMGLTLRDGNREYFYQKLDEHFPGLRKKYEQKYGYGYHLLSDDHQKLMKIFRDECYKHSILYNNEEIFTYLIQFEDKQEAKQLSWFDRF